MRTIFRYRISGIGALRMINFRHRGMNVSLEQARKSPEILEKKYGDKIEKIGGILVLMNWPKNE